MGVGSDKDRVDLSEIMREKLYFAPLHRSDDSAVVQCLPKPATGFSIDNELVYEPFFADFGPLNLACTYRFCWKLHGLLKEADEQNQCVFFCCSADPKKKSNAAVLLGAYLVLFGGVEAEAAYGPLSMFEPYLPFRDPTCGISTYHLTVLDCIRAILKAHKVGWIDFNNFNLDEYEYFEQVENGDLNWIVPNKLMAFSGPSTRRLEIYGYSKLVPEDYVEYFHRVGVTGVIRLNRRAYDKQRFIEHSLAHYDLYFPDGSCPPERIVKRFLEIVEETSGALAVHCKIYLDFLLALYGMRAVWRQCDGSGAGLGRTGVLIGCYIMKHYRFTCNETLGYLRIVRPGSVIGPQQHFLRDMQSRMWKAGDAMRNQQTQGNSHNRQVYPPSGQDNLSSLYEPGNAVFPAGAGWTQNNNRINSSRKYAASPVLRRDAVRDRDWSAGAGRLQDRANQRSRHISWSETVPPQQRMKRLSHSNVVVSSSQPIEDEGSGSLRSRKQNIGRIPTPARNSFSLRGFSGGKAVNLETAIGGLSMNSDPEPSSSSFSKKKNLNNLSPYKERPSPNNNARRQSPSHNAPVDSPGILRNATGAAPKVQGGGAVVVQRILNAAGQPRKVVMPIPEDGLALPGQDPPRKREISPSRRYSTPGRTNNNYGKSPDYGS